MKYILFANRCDTKGLAQLEETVNSAATIGYELLFAYGLASDREASNFVWMVKKDDSAKKSTSVSSCSE